MPRFLDVPTWYDESGNLITCTGIGIVGESFDSAVVSPSTIVLNTLDGAEDGALYLGTNDQTFINATSIVLGIGQQGSVVMIIKAQATGRHYFYKLTIK